MMPVCSLFQNPASIVPNSTPSPLIPSFSLPTPASNLRLLPITSDLKLGKRNRRLRAVESSGSVDEDEELCPVDCVREFYTDEEFLKILEKSKETKSLVVVDFYRTSCGSCKYIEKGFAKMCRGAGDRDDSVVFLKHNVSV
ncbi:uncharacterized protein A4U43_UnF10350 [Asparagus officinalis]|uniref:Thioredoxin domain-containing protein n=1 Tax=Asparagus officinalis TaxID=4686 RepID=A0A1R3L5H8_ASPOF|nr:thioredoxin-like 4, chloroplastic [Asparagus officinalis]ONK54864.1 uncharacterized protein A4U43_UnF10350 [Asparagus officinalis]